MKYRFIVTVTDNGDGLPLLVEGVKEEFITKGNDGFYTPVGVVSNADIDIVLSALKDGVVSVLPKVDPSTVMSERAKGNKLIRDW